MTNLIDKCRNCNGQLDQEVKDQLQALLDNPCVATWEKAHSIIIRVHPMMTLWQAWVAIDSEAPRRGRVYDFYGKLIRDWERIPSALTIRRALQYATE